MNLIKKLQQAYPQVLGKWQSIIGISAFVAFFLTFFQPFGLQFVELKHKELILAGYGIVTLFALIINLIILPKIFKRIFIEEKWILIKQIIWVLWIIFSISLGNYLYSIAFSIFPWAGIKGLIVFSIYTLSIAIIPITVLSFITQNIYLKKNIASSTKINSQLQEKHNTKSQLKETFSIESGKKTQHFQPENIVAIESQGNYAKIYYVSEQRGIQHKLLRNTLKNIQAKTENIQILFRCHRAFIVNLEQIEKVDGNSRGYTLKMKQLDLEIPVSRNYIKTFKQRIT